jgi:hypothetical protein
VFTPSNLQEDAQKHETVDEKGDDKHENVIVQSNTGEGKCKISHDSFGQVN